jgi:DNA-binding GntR family transcriptional regulator
MTGSPRPIARSITKQAFAYSQIRTLIVDGTLAPGTPLQLRPLAERLGVSVMPVRDALRALGAEGLVETTDHGSSRVANVSTSEILEIVSIRMWLEVHAVMRSVGKHDERSLEKARQALVRGGKAVKAGRGLTFTQANRSFHLAIEGPAADLGTTMIDDLWDRTWKVRRQSSLFVLAPEQMAKAHREHRDILKAVEQEDVDAAVTAMERHRLTMLGAWKHLLGSAALG